MRRTVNTKCSLHLSYSGLHICTPGSFSGYQIPSLLLPSSLLHLIISFPFSATSQACLLLLQCFLPCGESAPRLTRSVTYSSHSTLLSFPLFFFFFPSEQTPLHTHSHVLLYPPFAWIMSLRSESTREAFSLLFLLHQDKLMETYQCTV